MLDNYILCEYNIHKMNICIESRFIHNFMMEAVK